MKQFEYLVRIPFLSNLRVALEKVGLNGWDLINVNMIEEKDYPPKFILIFKKEKKEMEKLKFGGNKITDNWKTDYECATQQLCINCFWSNGEECIRLLLTEADVEEILKKRNNNG